MKKLLILFLAFTFVTPIFSENLPFAPKAKHKKHKTKKCKHKKNRNFQYKECYR